jgi:hypothetical protein
MAILANLPVLPITGKPVLQSLLNNTQYGTLFILVLNQYFKKVLKFNSILVLFQIKLLNVLGRPKWCGG